MANYNVETGYKPEFALGALYAGQNAANQESMAQEELIKSYLANQREVSMQPLDVDIKSKEAAQARSLNTPDLLQRFAAGKGGEWDSQRVKGEEDVALSPSNIFAKKEKNLRGGTEDQLYGTLASLDQSLSTGLTQQGTPFSPEEMGQLKQYREQLMSYLVANPAHRQKLAEIEATGAWHANVANIQGQNQQNAAKINAEAKTDQQKLNEQFAGHLDIVSNPNKYPAEQVAVSRAWIDAYNNSYLARNAAAYQPKPIVPGLPYGQSPIQKQGGSTATPPQKANTQAEFDTAWAKLSPGQSLVAPDGKTYTKK